MARMEMRKLAPLTAAVSFVITASAQAAVPHTFEAGQPALASEVNINFDSLDARLAAIESNNQVHIINVDCSRDANALQGALNDLPLRGRKTLDITGMCAGPVHIHREAVTLRGAGGSSLGNGISLAAGDVNVTALTVNARGTRVEQLTIDISSSYGQAPLGVYDGSLDLYGITVPNTDSRATVWFSYGAYGRMKGNSGFWVDISRNASVKLEENNTDMKFWVGDSGHLTVQKSGNTISSLDVGRGGSFRARDVGLELTGGVNVFEGATVRLQGSRVNGAVRLNSGSSLKLQDGASVNGNTSVQGSSSLVLQNTTLTGGLYVAGSSSVELGDGASVSAGGVSAEFNEQLNIHLNSTLTAWGNVTLSGALSTFAGGKVFLGDGNGVAGLVVTCDEQNDVSTAASGSICP